MVAPRCPVPTEALGLVGAWTLLGSLLPLDLRLAVPELIAMRQPARRRG
jgi:hypothetical protein